MQRDIAVEIVTLMREFSEKLDRSVQLVQNTCSPEEFVDYRDAVGEIMGSQVVDVMTSIFKEHPDLEPDSLKR